MKWLILASLIAASVLRLPAPLVRIQSGLVRGRVAGRGAFREYLGVPYATVDSTNRFQDPLPAPSWNGIFEAHDENSWCPQLSLGPLVIGEPNCLKLNIYAPTQSTKLLPVMVFIHGGCFFFGSGSPCLYGGDYFAEHGVVMVVINYRLGVEGFLCLGIKEAPGNAGLKDQIAALKWIRENIEAFGGNPNDVTLFGESAGAVSTSLLILSAAAKGLFHKAILQSGSSLAPWGMQHDPLKTARVLVKKLGYNTKDPREMYNIIANRTAQELLQTIYIHENKYCVAEKDLFVPCVEKHIEGVEPVITEHPADIIASGNYNKVPMIIGYNNNEGIYFVAADYGTSINKYSAPIDPLQVLQRDLVFPSGFEKNYTSDILKEHYFSSAKDELIMDMVNLYSDVHFKVPQVLELDLYSKTNDRPMYYYLFRYSGFMNMPKMISGFGLTEGASHADDLFYMFNPRSIPLPNRYLEEVMVKRMVTLWTNFAKYGDPTPQRSSLLPVRWFPSRRRNPIALLIDTEISTVPLWDEASVALWNDTYNKYRRKNYGFKKTKR